MLIQKLYTLLLSVSRYFYKRFQFQTRWTCVSIISEILEHSYFPLFNLLAVEKCVCVTFEGQKKCDLVSILIPEMKEHFHFFF